MRDEATGRGFFVINVHNSPANQEADRDSATRREIRLFNQLRERNGPVLILGDANERREWFCKVARRTGETKTEAVTQALRERLARLRRERSKRRLADELEAIAEHCASLPVLDARTPDEILEYDDRGLPC